MVAFSILWANYPTGSALDALKAKCFNRQKDSSEPFDDYCAIELSECLLQSGVALGSVHGTKCWSHEGAKHVLLAEQLATGLSSVPGLAGPRVKVKVSEWQSELADKTGIVFFKDYWARGRETDVSRSGDHIDLWNGSRITSSRMWTRWVYEHLHIVSYLSNSREIWFWPIA